MTGGKWLGTAAATVVAAVGIAVVAAAERPGRWIRRAFGLVLF